MEPEAIDASKLRRLLVVPVSLFLVWLVASLAPTQYEKVHEMLPSLNVDWNPGQSPYNESKLALVMEDRPLAHLTQLLLHMISVVPPDWPFLFIGSTESLNHINASIGVQMHQSSGKLELLEVPSTGMDVPVTITDRLLTNLTFYQEHVDPAEWLLVLHTDSILCARSGSTVNDWLDYDWVGARWSTPDRNPGYGGLSLRRVSRTKQVLDFQDWQVDGGPEDRWFAGRIGTLAGIKIPSPEVEERFCVQSVFHEEPLGYHIGSSGYDLHIDVWNNAEQRKKIFEWCPEIKMILDMKLERERCTEEDTRFKAEEARQKVKGQGDGKKEEMNMGKGPNWPDEEPRLPTSTAAATNAPDEQTASSDDSPSNASEMPDEQIDGTVQVVAEDDGDETSLAVPDGDAARVLTVFERQPQRAQPTERWYTIDSA